MTHTIVTKNDASVVADVDNHWLKEAEYEAEHTAGKEIVVDISAVAKICSEELNQLIRLHLDLKQRGRVLVLQHAQRQLWEVFTLTRLNRLFEIRDPQSE